MDGFFCGWLAGWLGSGWLLFGAVVFKPGDFCVSFFPSFGVQVLSQFASATKQYHPQLVEVPPGARMQSWQMSRLKMFHVILVVTVSWLGVNPNYAKLAADDTT